ENAASQLALHYQTFPGMGRMEILLDGERVAQLPAPSVDGAEEEKGAKVVTFGAPGARHTLTVRNLGPGPITLFGAAAEWDAAGVVVDAAGLPSSTIFTLASYDPEALRLQIEARKPDLLVTFYGTNESGLESVDMAAMRSAYTHVFETFRKA